MMHGGEKSDPVIVAGKPTNKAASAVAELVEQRYGTRGERRTAKHGPGSAPDFHVSQALRRVRRTTKDWYTVIT